MKKLLNQIDLFGNVFTFTTFNQSKFTNALGGVFTIAVVGLMLALVVVFGEPVYRKLNPNVIVQEIDLESYPFYNLTNEQFPFAYRYENERRIPTPNVGKYIFPLIQFIQQKKNLEGVYTTYNMKILKSAPCTAELLNNTELATSLEGYECVDFSNQNVTLGGLWENGNNFTNYFKVTLFMCQYDGNATYTNCTDYDTMNGILNGQIKQYLSIMIPDVSITGTDPISPMKVVTTNYFFTLSPLMMRTDRFYYKGVTVKQDTGWFLENYNFYDGFTLERRDTDIQMRTIEDYKDNNKIRTIATAVVLGGKKEKTYQVNFQKVQYVIANLGGILQIFMTAFTFIQSYINSHLSYFFIANRIFDFHDKDSNLKHAAKFKFSQMFDNDKSIDKSGTNLETKPKPENVTSGTNVQPGPSSRINHVRIDHRTKSTKRVTKLLHFSKMKNKTKNSLKLPLSIVIKKLLFCSNRDTNEHSKLYFHSEDIVKSRLDIIYYLRFINKMDHLMKLFLSPEQTNCLRFINNERIDVEKTKHTTDEVYMPLEQDSHFDDVKNVYRYFSRRKQAGEISELDEKIIALLDEKL